LEKRALALRKEDTEKKSRKSHQNPDVLRMYKEYLGEFGGKGAQTVAYDLHEQVHKKRVR